MTTLDLDQHLDCDVFATCVDAISIFAHFLDGNDKAAKKSTADLKAV